MEGRKEVLVFDENQIKSTQEALNDVVEGGNTASPDQDHIALGQTGIDTTNRAGGRGALSAADVSSSNVDLLADNFGGNYRPSSMYRLGSFSTPDLGPTRTYAHQDGASFPRRGLFSRVTNPFSRRNRNDMDRSQIGSPMPIVNENATSSIHRVGDIRLVRNLELERQARLMGFELPQNRFGLPEEISGESVVYAENRNRLSLDVETVVDQVTSDEVDVSTVNASKINETECSASYPKPVQNSPPNTANVATPDRVRVLDNQQRASRYSTSWLSNSFTTHRTEEFLHNFGSPPSIPEFPPRSSSLPEMAPGNPQSVHNLGEHEIRESDGSEAGHQTAAITRADENDRLRGIVHEIVGRFLGRLAVKDAEIRDLNARVTTAQEKVKFLEGYMEGHKAGLEGQKAFAKSDRDSDNHNKSGLMPSSTSSFGGSSGGRSSDKKSTSKEGGFFKSLIGTTEPSHAALKKLKERSLAEANADEKDLGLAAKLKVSSRQLPPEAPKPASKEPVPVPKTCQRHSRSTGTLTGQFDTELIQSLDLLSRATPARPESLSGPERVSLDKPLAEMKADEDEKDEGKKDGKKRGLRGFFSRK